MPTPYDYTGTGVSAAAPNSFVNGNAVVFKKKFALSGSYVQNDVFQIIDVPAGFYCLGVALNVTTAVAAVTDLDIGDGDTVDGYQDGISCATTGFKQSGNGLGAGAYVEGGGKFYTSADTIDLKCISNTDANGLAGTLYAFGFMAE